MRVLVIGLGDIARKAYLPVLGSMPGVELHLATRNADALRLAGEQYRIPFLYEGLEDALAAATFDAAFVHAATVAHPAIVERLLDARVPVFVDKPLADSFGEAARLVDLADSKGLLLAVGFNRRFAPGYAALRDRPNDMVLMQKHRCGPLDAPRRTVFDDFIHVVDTLMFLSPGTAPRVTIETRVVDGLLRSVTVMLASDAQIAVGCMNRDSGIDEERLDAIGGGAKRSVLNLSDVREQSGGAERTVRRPDWASVGRQRGFEAMCADFLQAVRNGRATASEDILATHRLCEDVVHHAESSKS